MAEAQLLAELTQTKAELDRLKERISVGTPTIHKDQFLNFFDPNIVRVRIGSALRRISVEYRKFRPYGFEGRCVQIRDCNPPA